MRKREIESGIRRVQRDNVRIEEACTRRDQNKAKLENGIRKDRTQRLLRLGTNAWIAGLLDIDLDILEGALRRARPLASDPVWRRRWWKAGEVACTEWEEGGKERALQYSLKNVAGDGMASARKALNRRLIELGAIFEKTGWGEEDPKILIGALQVVKQGVGDPRSVERWKAAATVGDQNSRESTRSEGLQRSFVGPVGGVQP